MRLAGRLLLIAAATLSLAASCGQREDKADDAAMALLQARLPGRYDNVTQARRRRAPAAASPLPAIDLLIIPANAALIGKAIFYVRETAAGDPQRVLSQYIWVFGRAIEVHRKGDKEPKPPKRTVSEKDAASRAARLPVQGTASLAAASANNPNCSNRCCLRTWTG